MTNNKFDIYDRIFKFTLSVIKLLRLLPHNEENLVIIRQLLRSVTSIGANSQEADGVTSKKDFIHCFTVVRKESKETLFWLKLVLELNPKLENDMQSLVKECEEIIAIVSKIIIKSRA